MDSPAVQYVTTSDGYDIAYAVSGSGPPLVALGNTGLEHIQLAWQVPPLRAWLEALTQRFKLVQIDRRGSGLSARGLPADLTMDDFQKDIDAVVGHLGLGRFLLYGALYHLSYVPVQYAVQHPDSVAALILMGTGTSLAAYRAPSLFESVADQDWDLFLRSLALVGRGARTSTEVDRIVALYKQVYDKEDFVTGARVNATTPLDPMLRQLRTPTLVLYPRGWTMLSPDEPMKVARLARAKMVAIDGRNVTEIDVEQGLHAIEEFLAGLPPKQVLGDTESLETMGSPLSNRELEVLRLLTAGKSNREIADELVISANTVRRHVSNIFDKTGVSNRAQAALYARDHGVT